jgi:LDH2 family malate/lactate/ureidoglycolate dehydrogenase
MNDAVPRISADALTAFVAELFARLGVPATGARTTARALVAADLDGVPSHGVMLVPMYVDRLVAGSVSKAGAASVARDDGSAVVLDAGNALGQITSHQAVGRLVERAREHGLASVAVRNAFHFGAAGYWARALADAGLIGVAMCNTRPLMPAPGGAERLVGNNPLAIAFPAAGGEPLVLDMALSATAMGKIRLAESAGESIPAGWAVDGEGRPTTDPATAIKGMLLPAAGPKGFGLALMIDLLCGGLSGGAIGAEVKPLYGDPAAPYGCAHLFLAIAPAKFGVEGELATRVAAFAESVRGSKPASGVERVHAPGDVERARREANAGTCPLPADVLEKLVAAGQRFGVPAASLTTQ